MTEPCAGVGEGVGSLVITNNSGRIRFIVSLASCIILVLTVVLT